MILTAHQPTYLPWLAFFHKIALSDAFCSFDIAQYRRRGFNRNTIKTAQGTCFLTVPLLTHGYREKQLWQMEIDNSTDWRSKHFRSLMVSYKHAPFWSSYADFFEDVYKRDWKYFSELTDYILLWFLKELDIKVRYSKASEMHFEGKGSELVLDMCKKLGADAYIFGAFGKRYVKTKDFKGAGVQPYFQDYHYPKYPQQWGEFVSKLSIVDLLFNCGGKSLEVLMEGNIQREELVKSGAESAQEIPSGISDQSELDQSELDDLWQ
ncbi:WbqC family protein [Candidatus Uhrbacteria bacterium]|nr:WbqC family protein [Candidatus Uhrbacteria bacterium]